MRGLFAGAALGLVLATSAIPALAQAIEPGKEGKLAEIVKPRAGARACFARIYDNKHLAAHPHQQVTQVEFRLAYHIFDPEDQYPKGQRNYYFEMRAKTREHNGKRPLKADGECGPTQDGKGIFCGVECDGGGVMITQRDGGKLLIDLQSLGRIRMTESCDDDETGGIELESGRDDKSFLLSPVSQGECPAYDNW